VKLRLTAAATASASICSAKETYETSNVIKRPMKRQKETYNMSKETQTCYFRDTAADCCGLCLHINMCCKRDLSYIKKRPTARQKETYDTSKRDQNKSAAECCGHCLCINMLCKRDLFCVKKRPVTPQKETYNMSKQTSNTSIS